jgi:hypothetical protein
MDSFDGGLLRRMLAEVEFAPSNRQLVDYWLSLCFGDKLPERAAIRPADIKPLLAGLIMFDVVPGKSITVRLAGTAFNIAFGMELKGKDWVEIAPESYRPQRLRMFSDIAMGAIGRGKRRVEMLPTGDYCFEEAFLPCRAEPKSGIYPVVGHIDWSPGREFAKIKSTEQAMGPPLAFEIIPLPALKAA